MEHTPEGSSFRLEDGKEVRCRLLVDCSGHYTELVERDGEHNPGVQIAYGAEVEVKGAGDPLRCSVAPRVPPCIGLAGSVFPVGILPSLSLPHAHPLRDCRVRERTPAWCYDESGVVSSLEDGSIARSAQPVLSSDQLESVPEPQPSPHGNISRVGSAHR